MHFEVETFYAKDTKLLHHFFDIHVSFEVLKSTESQILAEAFDLNDFLLMQYRDWIVFRFLRLFDTWKFMTVFRINLNQKISISYFLRGEATWLFEFLHMPNIERLYGI